MLPAWRSRLAQGLHRAWRRRGFVAFALRPLSWLTLAVTSLKARAYRTGHKSAYRADVPVIVIGNLYVGGTGKTPLLLATLEALRARGWHPGVVSRGYGVDVGATPKVGRGAQVTAGGFGDEPALIARESRVPVAVHPRRGAAAAALLAAFPEVDILLADDGLQHLALARDIEILVEDERGIGNGLILPAGPLRESAARRRRVDRIVRNLSAPSSMEESSSAPTGVTLMRVTPAGARRLSDGHTLSLDALGASAARIVAVAGIGQPERFFSGLRLAGLELAGTLALPDHFDYADAPFRQLAADIILMTEKDAVKCQGFDDDRLWAVPVKVALSDPDFFDWLHVRARARGRQLDPSRHGHTLA